MITFLFVVMIVGSAALVSCPLGRYLCWIMDPRITAYPTASAATIPVVATSGGAAASISTRRSAVRRFAIAHVVITRFVTVRFVIARFVNVRFLIWQTRFLQRLGGRCACGEQTWRQYLAALLVFNLVMFVVGFVLLACQHLLPLNPDARGSLSPSLIFNTIASFTTNTDLQHYAGETTLSYFSQFGALMWLQFVSAATGLAVLAALARGLAGRTTPGNFFMDVARASLFILLPGALLIAVLLVLGGVPMTLGGSIHATTLEGLDQTIARGPVAAFVAIKQLGTNGGGFFAANGTHPFANPTFWTNALSMFAMLVLPMAGVWMFGRIIGRLKHAAVIFAVMLALLVTAMSASIAFESAPTPAFSDLPIAANVGNLEGKELRFGAAAAPVWAAITTSTSTGAVNAMHDSLNPLTGLVAMLGMWLNAGFGGIGTGVLNLFIYVVLTVFVAGMLAGRTPEYLGKRIEAREIKLAVLALILHPALVLGGTALFSAAPWASGVAVNAGPHAFSRILYEMSSAAANNGSGFEGLNDATLAWNIATGVVMLLARYLPIALAITIAGSLAIKNRGAQSAGTLSTEGGTFGVLLVATVVFIGALSFFPAATLGPIADQLLALAR